jgi:hypothetical protein
LGIGKSARNNEELQITNTNNKAKLKIMETQRNNNRIGGAIFVGCMFVGMGIGMYFNKMTVGIMIGMGVGFIGSAIARAKV